MKKILIGAVLALATLFSLTGHASASTTATVAVIGDSNTARAGNLSATALANVGYNPANVSVYGCGGKRILVKDACHTTTFDDITAARAKLGQVNTWEIALGTNDFGQLTDAQFTDAVSQVMAAIGPDDRVFWVDYTFRNPANTNAAHYNPLLSSALAAYPNAVYVPWNATVHAADTDDPALWLTNDVTHMTHVGYDFRTAYLAGLLAVR